MKESLGALEARFLSYAQLRGWRTVHTGQLVTPRGFTEQQEREVFRRLSRARIIARVRPGLYLVPPRLQLGGLWTPDPILALTTLIEDRNGRYQICGPNAFNRYGFDNQVPNRIYAYNNRISGSRRVGSMEFSLIKVTDRRLGAVHRERSTDGLVAVYSSRARTLVDAVYDWSRFAGLPRAYRWIRDDLAAGRVDPPDLVKIILRYGDTGTLRRMGALLERLRVAPALLRRIRGRLRPTSSPIPWIPTAIKRGTVDRRWGVVQNGEI